MTARTPTWHRFYNFDTGEYAPEFTAFEGAMIGEGAHNFDCEDVATAMVQGLTPAEAASCANESFIEEQEYARFCDREEALYGDHDFSMNG